MRLRRSDTPVFGDDAEDIAIASVKFPFYEDDSDKATPNKYNLLVKLPQDAPSGFYRLEW